MTTRVGTHIAARITGGERERSNGESPRVSTQILVTFVHEVVASNSVIARLLLEFFPTSDSVVSILQQRLHKLNPVKVFYIENYLHLNTFLSWKQSKNSNTKKYHFTSNKELFPCL